MWESQVDAPSRLNSHIVNMSNWISALTFLFSILLQFATILTNQYMASQQLSCIFYMWTNKTFDALRIPIFLANTWSNVFLLYETMDGMLKSLNSVKALDSWAKKRIASIELETFSGIVNDRSYLLLKGNHFKFV